ncbi:hypothetical protein D3C71_1449550 [compost metagenome]
MTKQSFEGIYGKWVMTGVELPAVNFDAYIADPMVNTLLKDFFEPLRKIKFGQPLDYMTEQFIKNTFSMSGDNTMGDDGLLKFRDKFVKNTLIDKASDRYYGASWPAKDFKESLVMFSAMITHGMIDETELRGFLK